MAGSGIIAYLVARGQGSKAAQTFLIEHESRSDHQKMIVVDAEKVWEKGLTNPQHILDIQRKGRDGIEVNFTPFPSTLQISYFEAHLSSGYGLIWSKIVDWRKGYSALVERTEDLATKIRGEIMSVSILPPSDIRSHDREHIRYPIFLQGYFHAIRHELEKTRDFELEHGSYRHGDETRYTLAISDNNFADSHTEKKILTLEAKVEELHNNSDFRVEFAEIAIESEKLTARMKELGGELRAIWVRVKNNVPLEGWCEAGIEGKYETTS